jgi:antibiotic biosynthesis monooxygenase (ABM) superfamily enzyme
MSIAAAERSPGDRSEVTSVIRHKVKDGEQPGYETWLREIVPVAAHFPGHRGVNVIRPAAGGSEYTVVLHFDTIDNLRAWLDSRERRALINKALPILAGEDSVEIKTGLEFWFTPPSRQQAARPYKQFLVTLSVIYPLTLLVPFLLRPAFDAIAPLDSLYLRQLLVDAAIVALITYVIMPRYVRLIARWLYR